MDSAGGKEGGPLSGRGFRRIDAWHRSAPEILDPTPAVTHRLSGRANSGI